MGLYVQHLMVPLRTNRGYDIVDCTCTFSGLPVVACLNLPSLSLNLSQCPRGAQ